jgi:outer membrane protein OmpA-like peptidoglycan-associated protein
MRSSSIALAFGLALLGGAALAQPPRPVHSPEDFAQAIKEAPCDDGQARDNGGACIPAAAGTRGFNLGAKARPRRTQTGGEGGGVAARTASATPSMLDDLNITFHSGSAEMTPEGQAEAKSFATALQMPWLSKRRFEIAGHTDISGSRKKNLVLSQARADAVADFLVAQGVDRARLESKGYGSEGLATPSAPRDPSNRRVEARSLN